MLEQLVFITLSVILFGIIFFKMIKKNTTEYIVILIVEAIGIIIDGVSLMSNANSNIIIKIITYLFSIIIPIVIVFLEYKNIDIINAIKFAKAKFYVSIGNNKKAKDILISITEKNPNSYSAHKMLAEIYEKEGGLRKAIDEYVLCIDINKKDYDSYYKVATLLTDFDKKDEAIEMLTNLLNKKPDYTNAAIALGDLLIEKEKFKEAANMVAETLKYNPTSFDLNYELGIIYTMLNDFQNAKEFYEKAAELNNLSYNSKYSLAQIALLYKELDQAEEYFQKTLEEDELEADSYYELAKINLIRGRKETAIQYANIAIDIDSKKIADKIKKEPLFIPILSKISIPFNLEEKEKMEGKRKLTAKEILAKEHLENTSNITTNMGYINMKEQAEEQYRDEFHKERGN